MRIATSLKLAALMPVLMALVMGAGLLVSFRSISRSADMQRTATRITDGLGDLRELAVTYDADNADRSRRQFLIKHDALAGVIAGATFNDAVEKRHLDNIAADVGQTKSLFLRLVDTSKRGGGPAEDAVQLQAQQVLTAQLFIRTRSARTDAVILSELISQDTIDEQRRVFGIISALVLLVAAMLSALLVTLVGRITGSLAALRSGTAAVGGGDLEYRIGAMPGDELGQLGESFDQMTERVQSVTVSKDRLEQEVQVRRQAEQDLIRRTKELSRSNAELEQFAYVASHDLQEPLRMVASYTQLLKRRYEGRLDADADDFIGYAVEGATRMQSLIEDLLEYSRISTRGKDPEPLDAEGALEDAVRNLRATIEETGAIVTHDPLPTVMVDPTQMTQLLQNLIGNAVKFRREDDTPRVDVSVQRDEDIWRFAVRDNGIGIDPQYFDRVFTVFQRLHARQEYDGSGIGLSICKRIVQRHGGRIWIESEPGTGSTFFFTLPGAPGKDFEQGGHE
jgi:signal transduction histidine kinase